MGGIWFPVISYVSSLSEFAGSRSGFALDRDELHKILLDLPGYEGQVLWDDEQEIRVRSEDYQTTAGFLLYKLGTTEVFTDGMSVMIDVYHKYASDPETLQLFNAISPRFIEWMREEVDEQSQQDNGSLDPLPFVESMAEKYGATGAQIAADLVFSLNAALIVYPWGDMVQTPWMDRLPLKELFSSASLDTPHGSYLDQRFIDYLSNNAEALEKMHWRKFEGLTAEYFERSGYEVSVGPGTNDGGVDVRVWNRDRDPSAPPLTLIQCKRQKEKVGKVIVKSLWADVEHEKANSGLVVTTSRLSPGAEEVVRARKYPILQADREKLITWLKQLRTPGTGVFLGE